MNKANISKPFIKAGWLRALIYFFAIILIVAFFLIGLSFSKFKTASGSGSFVPFSLDYDNSGLHQLVLFMLVFAFTYFFRRWIDRKPFVSLGFHTNGNFPDAMAGGMLAVCIVCSSSLILKGLGHLKWMDIIFDPKALFIAFGTIVIVSIYEELIFRGYILSNLLDSFPKWLAVLISSLLFMIFHWTTIGFFPLVNTLILGLILGLNYSYTRNLWFSICFHIGWKFLAGPVLGFPGSAFSQTLLQPDIHGDENITGGANGLEGSAIFMTVSLLSLLALYLFLQKKFNPRSQPVPGRM